MWSHKILYLHTWNLEHPQHTSKPFLSFSFQPLLSFSSFFNSCPPLPQQFLLCKVFCSLTCKIGGCLTCCSSIACISCISEMALANLASCSDIHYVHTHTLLTDILYRTCQPSPHTCIPAALTNFPPAARIQNHGPHMFTAVTFVKMQIHQ